jgi:large subunit ribosomal protein L2
LGNCLPLKNIPVGLAIHNIEMTLGKGGQMVRSAGSSATLMPRDEGYAQIRLPSGEIRKVNENCTAVIGQVSNPRMKTSCSVKLDAPVIVAFAR